jgi:hypothetical protein
VRVDDYMIRANKVFYFVLKWFMISCVYSCTWRELSFMTVTSSALSSSPVVMLSCISPRVLLMTTNKSQGLREGNFSFLSLLIY